MAIWRQVLDEQLDLVAAESRRTLLARLLLVLISGTLFAFNLGAMPAAAWITAAFAGEAWGWFSSARPASGTPNGLAGRLSYVGSMLAVCGTWCFAALSYWRTGTPGFHLVALAILGSMLIHAQCFGFRSRFALVCLAGAPAVLLIGMLALGGGFHGMELLTVTVTMTLAVSYLFISAGLNMKSAQALEAAQKEAVAANHAKSAFLAMMSHELRTPMNGVLGMAHALKTSQLDKRQQVQVDALIRSGGELMTILNDILDISKIEAGRLELETTDFDPVEVGERVHEMWSDLAAAKGVRLVFDVASGTPRRLSGDPNRLRQIMLNLVSNALKFTQAGEVRLALRPLTSASGAPDTARFEISVADTGIGISADQKARLFEAFAQAEAATARKYGGTGLGLAICKQLTDLMAGEIAVESQPGRGSVFRVTLELPLGRAPARVEAPANEGGVAGLHILVAEDNVLNQAVARAILEAVGCRIQVANDGVEALEMLRQGGFDLVLMDVHMPRMGGVEALARIRAGEAGEARLPVIALTADAMAGEDERLANLGFNDVQPKPIQPMTLIAAIAEACAGDRGEATAAA
ncbi:MAG TPA: ATP-binding protein [Phenylobacterium sp.]|nr:ATP-binding protein [Phenylobacterium sp.]